MMAQTERPAETDLDLPTQTTPEDARGMDRFRILGERTTLWYEGQTGTKGKYLIISFDNLATIGDGWPRKPWMHWRIAKLGYANLGVQSHAKDWYRLTDAAEMLARLQRGGFFEQFERVVLLGTSMGGFAALNYAQLIPNSTALAISAQSTMNREIAPFEGRFRYAVRGANWTDEPFLDAKDALPGLNNAFLLFDPRVPEDAAHAKRLVAPNLEQAKIAHCTHQAIRVLVLSDAIYPLLQGVVEENRITPEFWKAYRARRNVRKWAREFLQALPVATHPERSYRGALAVDRIKDMAAARRVMKKAQLSLARAEQSTAETQTPT